MRVFAAIVPPQDVLTELESVVRSVFPATSDDSPRRRVKPDAARPTGSGKHTAPKRRLLGRRSTGDVLELRNDELNPVPARLMHIPITTFGNVSQLDSVKLAEAMRTEVATWRRPELCVAGGTALEWPGDECVWARLGGDVDGLQELGRGVPPVVQRLSLFVDRRAFRPLLCVGRITDRTTAPYLEDLVAALEKFRGRTWVQESISLMKGVPNDDAGVPFEELERLPLARG